MAARVALAVAAVGVLGWLTVGLVAARLAVDGHELARQAITVEAGKRSTQALEHLHDAARLTPDDDPDADRAWLLHRLGRDRAAIGVLQGLVRAQPSNAGYWAELAQVSQRDRPDLARRARARLRALVPSTAPA